MFIMHISALIALSVLLGSTVLIIWSLRNKGEGSTLGKVIGFLVFGFSIISLACIAYYGIKYWVQGEFETQMSMTKEMDSEAMHKMMPMMIEKMKDHIGKMLNMNQMGSMDHMGMQKRENYKVLLDKF